MERIQHNVGLSFESKAPRVILHTGMGEFYSKMIGREGVRSFAPPESGKIGREGMEKFRPRRVEGFGFRVCSRPTHNV